VNSFAFQEPEVDFFANGNELYINGKYEEAINEYKKTIEAGYENGELYYNLGNAYYKLGAIGKSILYYERAKKFLPDDEELTNNLLLANIQVVDRIDSIPWIFYKKLWNNLKDIFILSSWTHIFLASWIIFWILISVIFFLRRRTFKRIVKFCLLVSIIVCFITSLVVISLVYDYKGIKRAIIMADEIKVYSGPDENETELYLIHEGTKVQIKRDAGEWLEVKLANGAVGWILQEDIEII